MNHKPGGRLPLLSAKPAVTPGTLKRAATNFAALNRGKMGVNSLPKTVTRFEPRPFCAFSTLTIRLPSHKPVFYRNGWTNQAGIGHGGFLPPILYYVVRKIQVAPKIRVILSGILS